MQKIISVVKYVFWNVFKILYKTVKEFISSNVANLFYSKSSPRALEHSKDTPKALEHMRHMDTRGTLFSSLLSAKSPIWLQKLPLRLCCVWSKNFSKSSSSKTTCKIKFPFCWKKLNYINVSTFVFVVVTKADAVILISCFFLSRLSKQKMRWYHKFHSVFWSCHTSGSKGNETQLMRTHEYLSLTFIILTNFLSDYMLLSCLYGITTTPPIAKLTILVKWLKVLLLTSWFRVPLKSQFIVINRNTNSCFIYFQFIFLILSMQLLFSYYVST